MKMECITIESHFGVPGHHILASTRNRCTEDLVKIITEISRILYPGVEIEVYLEPPEIGSYKDVIKIFKNGKKEFIKAPILTTGALTGIGILAVAILTYKDTHQEHLHTENMWAVEDSQKCLDLQKTILELESNEFIVEGLDKSKLEEVCGSIKITKLKNDRYKTLEEDEMVASEETVLKGLNNEVVLQKNIPREEFACYIENLPEEQEFTMQDQEGVIELISLVVRQKKAGRGIPWRGAYFGEDVVKNGMKILENGEEVNFYMQDENFKRKISSHEVSFSSDDNVTAIFDLKVSLNAEGVVSKSIYIKNVVEFNDVEIVRTIKPKQTAKSSVSDNQESLF